MRAGRRSKGTSATPCSPTPWSRRWTRQASRPRTSSATRSLQLASRGRAKAVVALAPAGGCAQDDESYKDLLSFQSTMQDLLKIAAPHAEAMLASPQARRRATQYIATSFEHIPVELLALLSWPSAAAR